MSTRTSVIGIQDSIRKLRLSWGVFIGTALLFSFLGYRFAVELWPEPYPLRWLILSSFGMLYFIVGLWRNLDRNHRPEETQILPNFGLGNLLSLLRGLLMLFLVGFLFQPWPGGGQISDWRAWIPGFLYTVAALPDYVDGYFARITNHVTILGEWLDMTLDSIGVFTATLLAVQYGTIPWWYLPIGLARYLFLAGIWLRQRRGLLVYELPYSVRRRGFAALKMGFIFVILLPPFRPPATYLGAAAFGIPFILGFVWDWLIVSGALPPEAGNEYPKLKQFTLSWLPLLPRMLAIILIIAPIQYHLETPNLEKLGYLEIFVTILIALGIWPRSLAILAVCLVGVNQVFAPLALDQLTLIVVYISIIFLGTGAYSLWPFEERLIHSRQGDRK